MLAHVAAGTARPEAEPGIPRGRILHLQGDSPDCSGTCSRDTCTGEVVDPARGAQFFWEALSHDTRFCRLFWSSWSADGCLRRRGVPVILAAGALGEGLVLTGSRAGQRHGGFRAGGYRDHGRSSDFSALVASGSGDVVVVQGDTEGLVVEAEDNLMALIGSEVDNGTLRLGFTPTLSTVSILRTRPIRYLLTVKSLESVSLNGSGKPHRCRAAGVAASVRHLGQRQRQGGAGPGQRDRGGHPRLRQR